MHRPRMNTLSLLRNVLYSILIFVFNFHRHPLLLRWLKSDPVLTVSSSRDRCFGFVRHPAAASRQLFVSTWYTLSMAGQLRETVSYQIRNIAQAFTSISLLLHSVIHSIFIMAWIKIQFDLLWLSVIMEA